MEREGACFAGSVPALLTLNVPLIGLGIYANPAVQGPWLDCGGIVRATSPHFLRGILAPSPCSPMKPPSLDGGFKHN